MTDARTNTFGQFELRREIRIALRERRIPTPNETKRRVHFARLANAPETMSATRAAVVLVVPLPRIYMAIRDGELPAEKLFRDDGRYYWQIDRGDVEEFGRQLYGRVSEHC
jgi:hypothetical protein